LGNHSKICAIPGETGLFLKNLNPAEINRKLDQFDKLTMDNGGSAWVEKTPKHIHFIEQMLFFRPQAKVLAMIRDPRDVACSLRARGFSFEEGLLRWLDDNKALLRHLKNEQVLVLSLEKLVRQPEEEMRKVLGFLALPYEYLLNYHLNKEPWYSNTVVESRPSNARGENHNHLRNWQINQPIFPDTRRYHKEMVGQDFEVLCQYRERILKIASRLGQELSDFPEMQQQSC
jgi:hypothetical protein